MSTADTNETAKRGGVFGWLDDRFGIAPLVDYMMHKEVPVGAHSMFWYYLGGLTLFFFSVQVATGLLLLVYYQVGEATSYESIRFITTKVPFGWLVRAMHCWSAHLMIISLVLHMLSTMMLKAYRRPRELTWLTGVGLFFIALGFGFSGYLLPWNELAFFATSVGTDSVKEVPVIGIWLMQVMRGGMDVSALTLYRFFSLHVVLLPLVIVGVVAVHVILIQRQGMAPPLGHAEHGEEKPGTPKRKGMPFFPDFALRDALLWLLCLILLCGLAVFLPYGPGIPGVEWELGTKANPLAAAYPGIKPEWYFLWVYQLLKEFPSHLFGFEGPQLALLAISALFLLWIAIPFLDRRANKQEPSPGFTDLGVGAVVFIGYLTLKAWDIGGGTGKLPDPALVARATALWMLGAGAIATAYRFFLLKQRFFLFSGAGLLQVALHGFGMSYLLAATIAVVVVAVGLAVLALKQKPTAAAGGHQ
jgi:cytochrome b6